MSIVSTELLHDFEFIFTNHSQGAMANLWCIKCDRSVKEFYSIDTAPRLAVLAKLARNHKTNNCDPAKASRNVKLTELEGTDDHAEALR